MIRSCLRSPVLLLALLTAGLLASAQPSGYTPGTISCWNFNTRPHQYFRASGWDSATGHTLVWFTGDAAQTCDSMLQHVVASILNGGWNGITTLADASTRKWQIIVMGPNAGYWLPDYANDLNYFYTHIGGVNVANKNLHHIGGYGGACSVGLGLLSNVQNTNSPYQGIFSTGIWIAPSLMSGDLRLDTIPTLRNYVWYGTADPHPENATDLYNRLSGRPGERRFLGATTGGAHNDSTGRDALKLAGTNNRWTWMLTLPASVRPEAYAGDNHSILFPASADTLRGRGVDVDGTISSYSWSKVAGGSCTIVSPSSATTAITGLSRGVYQFRLIVTDNSGLKDTAYTSISVTVPPITLTGETIRMIPITPFRTAENLVDGNLATVACDSYLNGNYAIPQEFIYILGNNGKDSTYDNVRIRFYNGSFAAGIRFNAWLMSDNFTDSIMLRDSTPYLGWKYMDTTITKYAPWPVRYIKFKVEGCASAFGEIQFLGSAVAPTSSFFLPQTFTQAAPKFTNYFGANVNGDEPDSLWNAFAAVRLNSATWYFDTATAGITPSTHKYVFSRWGDNIPGWVTKKNQYGINREMWFYTVGPSAANMPVPRPYNPADSNQYGYYAAYNDWKDIPNGSDSTNPANWINLGRLGYATAALFGKNTSASLSGYNITVSNNAAGQDLLTGIEFGNEDNKTWTPAIGYSSPQVKVATMSAAYDGHMGTLGARVGVKKADTSFKVYSGALVSADSSYLKAYCYWITRYRGKGNVPFNVLMVNAYLTNGGAQYSGDHGVTPGQFQAYEKWVKYLDIVHRMIGNVEVRWSEFGWDSNPGSIYSAIAHGSKDAQEVKADRMIQSYHIGRAAHLHGADQYRTRDEGEQANNNGFVTSGQFSGWPTFQRWKTSYWMSTTLAVFSGYNAWPDLVNNGDSTGIWVMRDDPVSGDTTIFTLFRGTNDGSIQNYTLNLGASAVWAQRIDMQNYNKTGKRTTLSVSGSTLSLDSIGESPVYIRVKYGSSLLRSKVNVIAYPNPSSGTVSLNVQRKFENAGLDRKWGPGATPVLVRQVKVYDGAGILVRTLHYGTGRSGTITVDLGNVPSGVYHFVITTASGLVEKEVMILKH